MVQNTPHLGVHGSVRTKCEVETNNYTNKFKDPQVMVNSFIRHKHALCQLAQRSEQDFEYHYQTHDEPYHTTEQRSEESAHEGSPQRHDTLNKLAEHSDTQR